MPDCEREEETRGFCKMHYMHFRRNDPSRLAPKPSVTDRFWARVNKTETCWLWTGAPTKNGGYGSLNIGRTPKAAHRISYEMAKGQIPEGMQIDHMCHTPLCVNPEHLRPVDHKRNQENLTGANRVSKSGIRGVFPHSCGNRWHVQVNHNGKCYNGGLFASIVDAEAAAVALRNKLFTHNDVDRIAA